MNQTVLARWVQICGALGSVALASPMRADTAVSINLAGEPQAFSNVNQTQGWRFTVNVPVKVTALGLLDAHSDGFQENHPIAIWDSQGSIVIDAILSQGDEDPLFNRFRYVSVESRGAALLLPGQQYTIGYFLSSQAPEDTFVTFNSTHTVHPAITQVGGRFFTFSDSLTMPNASSPGQAFGPNFQFLIVPGPATTLMLTVAFVARKTRHRS